MSVNDLYLLIVIPILTIILNSIREFVMSNHSSKKQKELYIHQKNFEKRFDLSQKLWDLLIENMKHTTQLRPRMDFVDNNKTLNEVKQERLNLWNKSFNNLNSTYHSGKPYFNDKLLGMIEEFMKKSNNEATDYSLVKLDSNNRIEYFKNSEENSKNLQSTLMKIKSEIGNQNKI